MRGISEPRLKVNKLCLLTEADASIMATCDVDGRGGEPDDVAREDAAGTPNICTKDSSKP